MRCFFKFLLKTSKSFTRVFFNCWPGNIVRNRCLCTTPFIPTCVGIPENRCHKAVLALIIYNAPWYFFFYSISFKKILVPGEHYAKWNKPSTEKQLLQVLIYMWELKKWITMKTESILVLTRGQEVSGEDKERLMNGYKHTVW